MIGKNGIQPKVKEEFDSRDTDDTQRDVALCGGIVFHVSTPSSGMIANSVSGALISGASSGFTAIALDVKLQESSGGANHKWFNGTIATSGIVVSTAESGDATLRSGTTTTLSGDCNLIKGVGQMNVVGTSLWETGDTVVLKVPDTTILGYTVATKSVTLTCLAAT